MVEVVTTHVSLLGEGPVWDKRTNSICWIDIINGEIHEYNTAKEAFKTTKLNRMIGAIAICTNGEFLVALKGGLGILKRVKQKLDLFSYPEAHLTNNRFNDGKCDPMGRFWIGTMAIDEAPDAGSLYILDSHHNVTKTIGNTTISNGMAWSPDHKTFYHIDSPTLKVIGFDYDLKTGEITNGRPVFATPKSDGYPDGMTIDTEGMLWVAHWGGWQVTRWNPVTGEKLLSIPLPVANVTSCTFGGNEYKDLYITTAKYKLTDDEKISQPLAGKLFVWKNCGYQGVAPFEYKTLNIL